MATAQAMREQEKTVTWSSIFPSQQVTEQQSALFVKKLLAVAVSSITYLRTIFPEHAFGDRCLEDLNLKILKDDSACPGACQVIQWIKGCFDALDKRYLRMIVIGIYGDAENPDTVIETYTFKITDLISFNPLPVDLKLPQNKLLIPENILKSYCHSCNECSVGLSRLFSYVGGEVSIFRNGNKIASAQTEKETKKATIRLLRTIILLSQTLASLPDDVMMTMKLLYYDEVTPPDYEPPGFKHTPNDFFNFVEEPLNIKVGDVSTPFHTVKLRIRTDCQQFELKDDNNNEEVYSIDLEPVTSPSKESNLQESSIQQQQVEANNPVKSLSSPCDIEQEGGQMSEEIREVKDKGLEVMDCDQELPDQSQQDGEEVINVKCPCGNDEDEGLMILCGVCNNWQHAVCFGVLKQEEAPELHVCVGCSKGEYSGKCTDSSLVNLNTIALQATCLWRRTLVACSELNRILPNTLARHLKLEMSIAQGLVKRLEKEGFIRSTLKGKRLGKIVNKKKLQAEGFGKYFSLGSGKLETEVDLSDTVGPDENKSEDGVEAIVQRCSKMDVSGALKTFKKKVCNKQGKLKRAVSLKDETMEFDISDSQEQCFEDRPQSKRRKASVAKSAILV